MCLSLSRSSTEEALDLLDLRITMLCSSVCFTQDHKDQRVLQATQALKETLDRKDRKESKDRKATKDRKETKEFRESKETKER